jgi:hypothetical protein
MKSISVVSADDQKSRRQNILIMETDMKRFLTALALVALFASAATARSYSPYNPAGADTSDPGSAPLVRDRAPRVFTPDAAARANTRDPGSAPLTVERPAAHRGRPLDAAGRADTSDPGPVHRFRSR